MLIYEGEKSPLKTAIKRWDGVPSLFVRGSSGDGKRFLKCGGGEGGAMARYYPLYRPPVHLFLPGFHVEICPGEVVCGLDPRADVIVIGGFRLLLTNRIFQV